MKCRIETGMPFKDIEKIFATELEHTHKRSETTLTNEGAHAVFTITAQDAVAMRASINGITSILSIYEKTHEF